MEGMVKIWTSTQPYQVELAKQKLQENGIEAFVINKQETITQAIGDVELYVAEENVTNAEKILHLFHSENVDE
jgi:Putative prokaryotic signal transducing protein